MEQPDRPEGPGAARTDPLARVAAAVASDRLDEAVAAVRQPIVADRGSSLGDPLVKAWIARRFQYLFTVECTRSREALALAGPDGEAWSGPAQRQECARQFLAGSDPDAVVAGQPDPPDPDLSGQTLLFAPGLLTGLLPELALGVRAQSGPTRAGLLRSRPHRRRAGPVRPSHR